MSIQNSYFMKQKFLSYFFLTDFTIKIQPRFSYYNFLLRSTCHFNIEHESLFRST